MQKRLNRSICRFTCGLEWAERCTSSIVFARWRQCALMGGHVAVTYQITLNHPSMAAVRLMANYFDHLLSLDTPTYTVAQTAKRVRPSTVLLAFHTIQPSSYSAPQCCTSYSNSVRLSVTRRYCVKTTARSTVQFALLDSKMCLVL